MPHYGPHGSLHVQHQDDERRVLSRIARGEATAKAIAEDLAARMTPPRVRRALYALHEAELIERVGAPHDLRATWRITDAGRAREAEWAVASAARTTLPVLPESPTPAAAFDCTRRRAVITVSQCAAAHAARAGGILPCGLAADGTESRTGCPTGEKAAAAMAARSNAKAAQRRQARKERVST